MDVKVMMEKMNNKDSRIVKDDTSISQILFDDVSVALTIVKLVLNRFGEAVSVKMAFQHFKHTGFECWKHELLTFQHFENTALTFSNIF